MKEREREGGGMRERGKKKREEVANHSKGSNATESHEGLHI